MCPIIHPPVLLWAFWLIPVVPIVAFLKAHLQKAQRKLSKVKTVVNSSGGKQTSWTDPASFLPFQRFLFPLFQIIHHFHWEESRKGAVGNLVHPFVNASYEYLAESSGKWLCKLSIISHFQVLGERILPFRVSPVLLSWTDARRCTNIKRSHPESCISILFNLVEFRTICHGFTLIICFSPIKLLNILTTRSTLWQLILFHFLLTCTRSYGMADYYYVDT